MTDCIHCNYPISIKSIRIMRSGSAFIHEECYKSLWKSFLCTAVLAAPFLSEEK